MGEMGGQGKGIQYKISFDRSILLGHGHLFFFSDTVIRQLPIRSNE